MIDEAEYNVLKEQVNSLLVHLPALNTARGLGQLVQKIKVREVDIPNGDLLARLSHDETVTGTWTFVHDLIFDSGTNYKGMFHHVNTANRTYTLPDKSGRLLDTFKAFSQFQSEVEPPKPIKPISVLKQNLVGEVDPTNQITKRQLKDLRFKMFAMAGS